MAQRVRRIWLLFDAASPILPRINDDLAIAATAAHFVLHLCQIASPKRRPAMFDPRQCSWPTREKYFSRNHGEGK
jgi:hypothetical protein